MNLNKLLDQYAYAEGIEVKDAYEHLANVLERQLIDEVLLRFRGNQKQAAEYLGINRLALYNRLLHLGIIKNPTALSKLTTNRRLQLSIRSK